MCLILINEQLASYHGMALSKKRLPSSNSAKSFLQKWSEHSIGAREKTDFIGKMVVEVSSIFIIVANLCRDFTLSPYKLI